MMLVVLLLATEKIGLNFRCDKHLIFGLLMCVVVGGGSGAAAAVKRNEILHQSAQLRPCRGGVQEYVTRLIYLNDACTRPRGRRDMAVNSSTENIFRPRQIAN